MISPEWGDQEGVMGPWWYKEEEYDDEEDEE